ncbi:hypothetical protein RRG08_018705 [Elysia crispata]|uniref:Uncharacterized protein n=1 Tax=Elysia crispata TaxID=231223 RepID=A0AAE0YFK0_9GAST|nr:hypothetical protein RRG08_018705 [Elysia crispata]
MGIKASAKVDGATPQQIDIVTANENRLGPLICHVLPFLHAINGCDTTSRLFRVAKGLPLLKIKLLMQISKQQREKALISLYGGRAGDTLDMLRYKRLWEKVTSSITTVQKRSLSNFSGSEVPQSACEYIQDRIDKICDVGMAVIFWQTGFIYNGSPTRP